MQAGDMLAATIHTHTTSRDFSDDDIRAGDRLGVPMVLIEPGARSARVYDPSSRSIQDFPLRGGATKQPALGCGCGTPTGYGLSRQSIPRITISETMPDPRLLANIVNVARTMRGADEKTVIFFSTHGEPALQADANKLSLDLLRKIITKARENIGSSDQDVLRAAIGRVALGGAAANTTPVASGSGRSLTTGSGDVSPRVDQGSGGLVGVMVTQPSLLRQRG